MSIHKSIAKSAGIIGFATLCSRILGFLRDVVIARMFGVYIYAQAFVVAFKIPNLLRDLLGEGASNAAFVPVFSEYKARRSPEEFWELANVVLNLLLVAVTAVTLLGIIFSPLIVRLVAPGFVADPIKLATTIQLNRIIFPYVILICLAAYATGLLNSLRHFAVPAFAPCFLNISIIICALVFGEGITGLASGVLIGGLLQLAVQIPVLYKKGFRLKRPKTYRHPAAKEIGLLMVPRVLSSSIYQLNNFVDSIFGSLAWIVGEGGVAILYFSYRLVLFPLGIFSTSLSQAMLPTFSTQVLEGTHDNLKKTLSFGLCATFFVLIPTSLGFMVLSKPIISAIFQGGKFDAYSADMTAKALFFYSIGLFAYGSTRVLQSCFFALKDTLTPMKVSFLALILNIVFNAILMFRMKISGIALATSISGTISFAVLFYLLRKRLGPFGIKAIFNSFLRILIASVCMAAVCYFTNAKIISPSAGMLIKFINLGFIIVLAVLSYIVFCFIFGVHEIKQVHKWLLKKK